MLDCLRHAVTFTLVKTCRCVAVGCHAWADKTIGVLIKAAGSDAGRSSQELINERLCCELVHQQHDIVSKLVDAAKFPACSPEPDLEAMSGVTGHGGHGQVSYVGDGCQGLSSEAQGVDVV